MPLFRHPKFVLPDQLYTSRMSSEVIIGCILRTVGKHNGVQCWLHGRRVTQLIYIETYRFLHKIYNQIFLRKCNFYNLKKGQIHMTLSVCHFLKIIFGQHTKRINNKTSIQRVRIHSATVKLKNIKKLNLLKIKVFIHRDFTT